MTGAQHLDGITTCVFDAYGTLFDIAASARKAETALGAKTAGELVALWRRKQLEYSWLRSLMKRHADFWQVTGESLDYAMAAHGVDDPVLRSRLMEDFLTPKPFPEVPSVLRTLRESGRKLAILSNGSPQMLAAACHATELGRQFDAVLSVESAGVFKPAPAVYRLALDRFGGEPSAIAFMSSNPWDVAGAAAFGFRVVWVNRAAAPPERLPAAAEAVIADLSALPGLLGS